LATSNNFIVRNGLTVGTTAIANSQGYWTGNNIGISVGGTGASDASAARTNLGLGSIATQSNTNVNITGGSITGITDLAVADGGTGASDASTARTNLGLGTIATQSSSSVSITGGSITGITDLAVADGGTGASDASNARTNLGLGSISTQSNTNVNITGGSITVSSHRVQSSSVQDAVAISGRAGGSSSYAVTLTPTTLGGNRTLTLPDASGTAVLDSATQSLSNKTLTGTQETVITITDGAAFEVNPANGGIQTITLGASRTPKATSFAAGQSVTLMVDDGTNYTLTWTDATWGTSGVAWVNGSVPALATTGYTIIEFWKIGTQVYGALVGYA
jgi:hypothetical protein